MIEYSLLLPVRNEDESLKLLFDQIHTAMKGKSYEVIAVDDASEDTTLSNLREIGKFYKPLKVVHFKKHQGKWGALEAGYGISKGKFIITMDSDLQDDPSEISNLLEKLGEGYDVVSGWRKNRKDPYYKVLISKIGNSFVSAVYGYKFYDLNSPFKVYRRDVFESLPKTGSLLRFSVLFAKNLGFKVAEVPVDHRARIHGKSKFGIVKYARIIYDLILVMLLFSGSGRVKKR